jgi:hypothetical protein
MTNDLKSIAQLLKDLGFRPEAGEGATRAFMRNLEQAAREGESNISVIPKPSAVPAPPTPEQLSLFADETCLSSSKKSS